MGEAIGNGFIQHYLEAIHLPKLGRSGKVAEKIRQNMPGVVGVAGIPVVLGYVIVGGALMLGIYGLNRSRGRAARRFGAQSFGSKHFIQDAPV